jgi:hypothetical protein
LIIEAFVNGIIFVGNDGLFKNFLEEMRSEFEMSMISEMKFFLGLQITQTKQGIFIVQTKYLKEMLNKFGMEDCKLVGTPMVIRCKLYKNDESKSVYQTKYKSMIGGLQYLTRTRLDIANAVGFVARFQADPKETNLAIVKRIFKYLKGTMEYGLWYDRSNNFTLQAYIDANWVGDTDDRKSTSGGSFFLGGRLVSWLSKK